MECNINRIFKWLETWSLELSPKKCKIMHLGKLSNPDDYLIAGGKRCFIMFSSCLIARGTNKSTLLHPKQSWLMENTFSSWSAETNHLSNSRQATPRVCVIILESSPWIRLKNIRKCPAQSNPYQRITSSALRKKTGFDLPEKNTRESESLFHPDLKDRARFRESKRVRRRY